MDRKQIKTPQRASQAAIPTSYIRSLIVQPENAGDKSRVLSWLLRKWSDEQNDRVKTKINDARISLAYRTPKKPESKNYHFGGMFLPACPTCGEFLTDEDYCPKCGQAIEWDGYEEE